MDDVVFELASPNEALVTSLYMLAGLSIVKEEATLTALNEKVVFQRQNTRFLQRQITRRMQEYGVHDFGICWAKTVEGRTFRVECQVHHSPTAVTAETEVAWKEFKGHQLVW